MKSKFDVLLPLKLLFFVIPSGLFLLYFTMSGFYEKQPHYVWILVVIFLAAIANAIYAAFDIFSIHITAEGLHLKYIITKKEKFVPYDAIDTLRKDYMYGLGHRETYPLTKGYYRTIILFKNGQKIMIGPEFYSNYIDLAREIQKYIS
jgi:hypothetical protein